MRTNHSYCYNIYSLKAIVRLAYRKLNVLLAISDSLLRCKAENEIERTRRQQTKTLDSYFVSNRFFTRLILRPSRAIIFRPSRTIPRSFTIRLTRFRLRQEKKKTRKTTAGDRVPSSLNSTRRSQATGSQQVNTVHTLRIYQG